MAVKLTNENYKQRIVDKFGDIFDLSLLSYTNMRTNVTVICKNCNTIIVKNPKDLLKSCGCPKCFKRKGRKDNNGKTLDTGKLLKKLNLIHNYFYDYSKTKFTFTSHIDVCCPKHGSFQCLLASHKKGYSCPKCSQEQKAQDWIKHCSEIHNNKYDYSLVEQIPNNRTKLKIFCKKHGIFAQSADHHSRGSGCPVCKTSKGELEIIKHLDDLSVLYETQYKFKDLVGLRNRPLRFDFYIQGIGCIEYNGKQHYEKVDWFGGEKGFIRTQQLDRLKHKYCLKNSIPLHIIRYDENIKDRLYKILNLF